jgi:hypothetical protein
MFGGQTSVSGVSGAGGMSFWGRPRIGDFGQWLQIGEITTPGDPILQITGSQVLTSVIATSTLGGADTVHNVLDNGNGYVGILTTAPDQPLTVNGIIHSTSGGIEFPDGTVQTTAAGGSVANGSQTWTTPGTYTWTVPNGVSRLIIAEWGGGNSGGVWGSDDVGGTAGSFTLGFLSVNSGQSVTIVVGAGGVNKGGGSASSVSNNSITVTAPGGGGGAASGTDVLVSFNGGFGGSNSVNMGYDVGGGAPSIMGYYPNEVSTGGYINAATTVTPSPGFGSLPGGGSGGGTGSSSSPNGGAGSQPGGGGGCAYTGGTPGSGGNGEVVIEW